jgi:hypothetical protein
MSCASRAAALSDNAIQRAVFQHIRKRATPGKFAFHPRNGSRDQRSLAGINSGRDWAGGFWGLGVHKLKDKGG